MDDIEVVQTDEIVGIASFYLADFLVGIEIECVQEINRNVSVRTVPCSSELVAGITNLRGNVITVIDPKGVLRLGRAELSGDNAIVIVEFEGEMVALLVDKVGDVIYVNRKQIEEPPANMGEADIKYFKFVCKLDSGLLAVLNLERVLSDSLLQEGSNLLEAM